MLIQFHVGPDGHRLQVGKAGLLRNAAGVTMRVGEGWFISADMAGVFGFSGQLDTDDVPPPADGFRTTGWDYVGGELVRVVEAIPPATLRRPQFKWFLRTVGLSDLYDAAIVALSASPDPFDNYAADVGREGYEFDFPTTLAFAEAIAAAQVPPVELDAAALRQVWDQAGTLALG